MNKLAELARVTERRVPPATAGHKQSTEEFLQYFEHRLLVALDAGRQLTIADMSPSLAGQIEYWQSAIKCIKWLKAMNRQRRTNG